MSANPVSLADLRSQNQVANREASMPTIQPGFGSLQSFELLQRAAKLMAASSLMPKEYQGNLPNCVVALNMAQRMGADPLMVAQNLYVVHGRPGWSSQFLIATFNQNGRFTALRYEFFGERDKPSWGCRAWAVERDTGEKLVGADITLSLAAKEGWDSKAGSKWKTMPQQMLMYRAASWFVRAYAPEIAMGLQTREEIHDVIDMDDIGEGHFTTSTQDLAASMPAGTIDAATGEITDSALARDPDMPQVTFAQLVSQMHGAKSLQALEDAAQFIQSLPKDQQMEATAEFKRDMDRLKKAGDQ
ncbi:MAG: hypothetical protein ACEQSH_00660 [Bacteroidia bacterium]